MKYGFCCLLLIFLLPVHTLYAADTSANIVAAKNAPIVKLNSPYVTSLVLDLDSKGIKTVNDSNGILFDVNGDGTKVGTGWISKDNGILFYDINKNNTVDNGKELFGEAFIKAEGCIARDGFDALNSLDTNKDGIIDNKDDNFELIKIWQDVNQDAISQTNEVRTLENLGIMSISLQNTVVNMQDNGNSILAEGCFTKADASQAKIAYIKLSSNPFYRQYGDKVKPTILTEDLPDMKGSGAVRDLREAATVDNKLAYQLMLYTQLQAKPDKLQVMKDLLLAWADSADFDDLYERVSKLTDQQTSFKFAFSWELEGKQPTPEQLAKKDLLDKLKIAEAFNAAQFYRFTKGRDQQNQIIVWVKEGAHNTFMTYPIEQQGIYYLTEQNFTFIPEQIKAIDAIYHILVDSVYRAISLKGQLSVTSQRF